MAQQAVIPVPASPMADATYAEQAGILARLKAGRDKVERELFDVESRLHDMLVEQLDDANDKAALALIHGTDDPSSDIETLHMRAAKLQRSLAAFRRAIVIQRNRVRDIRSELSADAAYAELPRHKAAVGAILAAAVALQDAIAAEQQVRSDLSERGFEVRLQEFSPPFGAAEQTNFTHAQWLAHAREYVK